MTKTWNSKSLLVLVLLLVMLVAIVTPVAATTIQLDLNQTYQFKNTHLTHIAAGLIGLCETILIFLLSFGNKSK